MRHSRLSDISNCRETASTGIYLTSDMAACSNSTVQSLPGRVQGTSYTFDAMFRTRRARHASMQVAVVLEEVQMPPSFVGKVVSLAGLTTLRTGIETASLRLDIEIQSVERHGGIQVLVLEDSGRFQAQAES